MHVPTRTEDVGMQVWCFAICGKGYFSMLQSPETDCREWAILGSRHKKEDVLKTYVFLIEKYVRDIIQGKKWLWIW